MKRFSRDDELQEIIRRFGYPIAIARVPERLGFKETEPEARSLRGSPEIILRYGKVWVATSRDLWESKDQMMRILGPVYWLRRKPRKETIRDDELVIGGQRYPAHAVDVKETPWPFWKVWRVWRIPSLWKWRRRIRITYPEIAIGATIDDRTVVLIGPPDEIEGIRLEWSS